MKKSYIMAFPPTWEKKEGRKSPEDKRLPSFTGVADLHIHVKLSLHLL